MKKNLYFKYNQNINNQLSYFLKTYKITKLTDVLVNLDNIKQPHPFGFLSRSETTKMPKGPGGTVIEPTVTSEVLTHKKYLTYQLPYPFGVRQIGAYTLSPLGKYCALPEGAKGGARFSIYAPKGAMVKLIKIKPTQRTYQFLQNILTKYLTTVSNERQLSLPHSGQKRVVAPKGQEQRALRAYIETFGPPKGGGVGPEYLIFSKINAKTFLSYWLIPLTGLAIYGPGLNTTKTNQTEQLGGIYSFNCLSLSAFSSPLGQRALYNQKPEGVRATFSNILLLPLRGNEHQQRAKSSHVSQYMPKDWCEAPTFQTKKREEMQLKSEIRQAKSLPRYLQPLTNLNVFSYHNVGVQHVSIYAQSPSGFICPKGVTRSTSLSESPKGGQEQYIAHRGPFGATSKAGPPEPKGPQRSPQALVSVAPLVSQKILNTNSSYITSHNCFKLLESKLSFYKLPPFRGPFGRATLSPKGNTKGQYIAHRGPEGATPRRGTKTTIYAPPSGPLWAYIARPLLLAKPIHVVGQTQKNFKTLNLSTIPVTNQTLAYKLLFNNIQRSCPEGATGFHPFGTAFQTKKWGLFGQYIEDCPKGATTKTPWAPSGAPLGNISRQREDIAYLQRSPDLDLIMFIFSQMVNNQKNANFFMTRAKIQYPLKLKMNLNKTKIQPLSVGTSHICPSRSLFGLKAESSPDSEDILPPLGNISLSGLSESKKSRLHPFGNISLRAPFGQYKPKGACRLTLQRSLNGGAGGANKITLSFKHQKMFKTSSQTRLDLQKKRKAKKQRLETRRQKKRTRFFPRPVWLRNRMFLTFINKRTPFGAKKNILPSSVGTDNWRSFQPSGPLWAFQTETPKGQLLANRSLRFFAKGELALRTNQRFKALASCNILPKGAPKWQRQRLVHSTLHGISSRFILPKGLVLSWRSQDAPTFGPGGPQRAYIEDCPGGATTKGGIYRQTLRDKLNVFRPGGAKAILDQAFWRDSLRAPLGSTKKAVNFLFKKQFLHNLKIKANYVNFKNQKTTNPAQIDKEKDKDTMFRDFWIWFYNNTVINKPDPPSGFLVAPKDSRSEPSGAFRPICETPKGHILWLLQTTPLAPKGPEGNNNQQREGPYFSKQMQNAFKVTQLHWALNKTNINVVTDYNKRYNLWGSQKLRNQSKNNKTKYLEKQFRTNWERQLAVPTAKSIFLNKNLSKFYKKISSKLQQKTQKLNYLTTPLRGAKNNQFIKTNTISSSGANIKNIIQVNNAWWASLELSPLRGDKEVNTPYSAKPNRAYIAPLGPRGQDKVTNVPPMSHQQVFMISTILLHFCAVVSLISISQVRCFVKFHLILLYKLSNLYNTLIKKMSEMISAVGTNFHLSRTKKLKAKTVIQGSINAYSRLLNKKRPGGQLIVQYITPEGGNDFLSQSEDRLADTTTEKPKGGTNKGAKNKLERYLQFTPQSQLQTNNKLLTFFSLNLLKKDFKLLSTFSNNKGSYPQSACSFGPLRGQPKGGTKVNLISLKSAISQKWLSPLWGRSPLRGDIYAQRAAIYYPPGPIANTRAKSLQNPKGVIYTWGQKGSKGPARQVLTTKKDYTIKQLKYFITKYTIGFPFGSREALWLSPQGTARDIYAQRAERLRASKKAVSLRNIIFYLIDLFQSVVYLLKSFFEKPAEFTTSWIAFGFLVEWSSDLITIIPENVDIYIWNTFFKTSRLIPFYTSINYLSFSTKTNLFNPVIYGNMPTHREGAGVPMFFLLSHLLQRRILYLFDTFIFTISHPDTDLIRRQQKGTLFWDVWADFLVTAADYYNVNVAALSTIKNEQNSLIENISNNSKQEFYKFFSKKMHTPQFNNQIARNILIKKTQTVTLRAYWQSQLNNEKGPESVNQYITYQSWHSHNGTNNSNGDLFIDYHPPKAFSHIPAIKYTNILQQPLGTLVCQIYSGLFNSKISKNILLIKPKILSNLKTAKNPAISYPEWGGVAPSKGASTDYNILLIQALAGETELKIITDNAQRYALVNRGFAIGIKLLRDVFDAIALNTPCIFLLLDIHAIGERRPMLISDYGGKNSDDNSAFKEDFFASIRDEVHEKNQVVYQLTRHALTHYQKPFKGDYSQVIPTNLFVALKGGDLFLKTPAQLLRPALLLPLRGNEQGGPQGAESQGSLSSKNFKNYYILSHLQLLKQKSKMSPPSTSPFTVLLLKEEKKLKPNKIVEELPWIGLPAEQLSTKPRTSYSIRAKVSMLAELSLSNLSAKLDMITDLLVIIDSVRSNKGFVVFATTDTPQILDPALRRPGRLDETLTLPLWGPNLLNTTNYEIFKYIKPKLNHNLTPSGAILSTISCPPGQRGPVSLTNVSEGLELSAFWSPLGPQRAESKKGHILSSFILPKFTVNVNNYNMLSAQRAERGILNYASLSERHSRNLKELLASSLPSREARRRGPFGQYIALAPKGQRRDAYKVQAPIQRAYIEKKGTLRAGKKVLTHLGGLSPSPERAPKGPKGKLKDITYYQVGKALLTIYAHRIGALLAKPRRVAPSGQEQAGAPTYGPSLFAVAGLTDPEGLKGLSDKEASQRGNSNQLMLVKQLMLLFSGTITQLLATQQISKLNNYLAPSAIYAQRAVRGEHKLLAPTDKTPLGVSSFVGATPQSGTPILQAFAVRGEMHKSYLYKKNLIVPKLLSFLNNTVLEQPPSPPFSSLLIPAKRFENYNRVVNNNVFGDKMGQRQAQITFVEKLQSHMSHFGAISLLKNKQSAVDFIRIAPSGQVNVSYTLLSERPEGTLRRGPIRGQKAPGYSDYQTFFKNMPNEQKLQTATNISWYYQNRILKRHGQYLTNQWWNGQLSEHNTETVFLSDIDWRSSFITPINKEKGGPLGISKTKNLYTLSTVVAPKGQKQYMPKGGPPGPTSLSERLFAVEGLGDTTKLDVLLDFPDTEQYYNPRQRRWLLNSGDWDFWFNFDTSREARYEEIMYTCILESIILTYNYLYNNLELLDFITTKCLVFASLGGQTNFKTENNLDLIYSQKRDNQNFVLCLKEIILTTAVKRF